MEGYLYKIFSFIYWIINILKKLFVEAVTWPPWYFWPIVFISSLVIYIIVRDTDAEDDEDADDDEDNDDEDDADDVEDDEDAGTREAGNCVVSAWDSWSDCSVDCGTGIQNRARTIQTEASGGTPCPVLSESQPCTQSPCLVQINQDGCVRNACSGLSQATVESQKGQCIDELDEHPLGYSCNCNDGYEGVNCELCSENYHVSNNDCISCVNGTNPRSDRWMSSDTSCD
jgi:hypothetical protein